MALGMTFRRLLLTCALAGCGVEGSPAGPMTADSFPTPTPEETGPQAERAREPHVQALPRRLDQAHTATPEQAPPALSGGTLGVAANGTVVIADADRDLVHLLDVAGELRTIELRAGDEPGRVAAGAQRAHVALRGAGELLSIDLASGDTTRTPLCGAPRGLALSDDGSELAAACGGGELVTFGADGVEESRVRVEHDLRDVGFDDGGLWATRYRSAELLRVQDDGSVTSRQQPASTSVESLAFGDVHEFTPTLAARTLSAPDGAPLMLHQRAQTSPIRIGAGGYGGDTFCDSGVVHVTVSRFDQQSPAALMALPSTVVPADLALSPDGSRAVAVSPGSYAQQRAVRDFDGGGFEPIAFNGGNLGATRQLAVLDVSTLASSTQSERPADAGVGCDWDAPQWEHVFPGEAVSVAFLDDARFVVQVREPSELRTFEFDDAGFARLVAVRGLSERSVLDTGHQLFHQSAGRGVACASCHGEGQDDAHTWDFEGIGPRRTQSLLGGMLGSEPFHWDGDMTDFRMLVDEVLTRRMGAPEINDDWANALGGWVDAQPARGWSVQLDAAAVARGRALFEDELNCTQCHSDAAYRGPGSFDVGTGGRFQVPSLIGVSRRLPIMHDGCAETLRDRFDPTCGGDEHGAEGLSEAQIDDMVAFLESL